MSNIRRLYLVGAGGFGAEAGELAEAVAANDPHLQWCGFLDENLDAPAEHPIAGRPSEWTPRDDEVFACAIGSPAVRERVVTGLQQRGARFVALIDPNAYVSRSACVGAGSVICRNAVISSRVSLGEHSIVLGLATIGHDSVVGPYSMISGGVQISGNTNLGERVFVGSNATVLPAIKVGSDCKIGAGSTVVRKVRAGASVFGVPAKRIAG